jgi:hypothetical protein
LARLIKALPQISAPRQDHGQVRFSGRRDSRPHRENKIIFVYQKQLALLSFPLAAARNGHHYLGHFCFVGQDEVRFGFWRYVPLLFGGTRWRAREDGGECGGSKKGIGFLNERARWMHYDG